MSTSDATADYVRELGENEDQALHSAISRFLFYDAERQAGDIGTDVQAMIAKGKEDRMRHDYSAARISFEEAAKLAFYFQDREAARNALELADQVPAQDSLLHAIHRTLLANLDKAMNLALSYYDGASGVSENSKDAQVM